MSCQYTWIHIQTRWLLITTPLHWTMYEILVECLWGRWELAIERTRQIWKTVFETPLLSFGIGLGATFAIGAPKTHPKGIKRYLNCTKWANVILFMGVSRYLYMIEISAPYWCCYWKISHCPTLRFPQMHAYLVTIYLIRYTMKGQ